MMPTFNSAGDIILVEHLSVRNGRLRVGDVIIARSVQNPRHVVCKRIRGLEGDVLMIPGSATMESRVVQVGFRHGLRTTNSSWVSLALEGSSSTIHPTCFHNTTGPQRACLAARRQCRSFVRLTALWASPNGVFTWKGALKSVAALGNRLGCTAYATITFF